MTRRAVTVITGGLLLLALLLASTRLPVPYVALEPGPTLDTLGTDENGKEIIAISGRAERRTEGHLNLTTVSLRDHIDLVTAFRGWLDPHRSVIPRDEVIPPGESQEQVDKASTEQFRESQSSAAFVALGELGYPQEVVVDSIPDKSPSTGKLRPKDVLTSVDAKPVRGYNDVSSVLTNVQPGATVEVGYLRDNRPGTARIVTSKASDRKGAAIGVVLTLQRKTPFTVSIELNDIGGPSAGLMFALGILEKVGPRELTGGRFIAGTGTLDFSGAVGPIGGIQLKMIAARAKGATVFLVPKDNCADALHKPPAGMQLLKIGTLNDALAALKDLREGKPAPAC